MRRDFRAGILESFLPNAGMVFFAFGQTAIDFGQLILLFSFSQRIIERRAVNFLLPVGEITENVFFVHEAIIQDSNTPGDWQSPGVLCGQRCGGSWGIRGISGWRWRIGQRGGIRQF